MHLFYKENIWSNPAVSCIHPVIQTSTIILQTELFPKKRREKIQGEILQSSSSTVFPHRIHPFYTQSSKLPVIPCQDNYSTYRINSTTRNLQEILQLQGSSRADQYKASSSDCSRASKYSTWQNKAPGSPTALQAHTAQAGFQLILPGRNSILSSSQYPQRPYKTPQAHSYRILQGEIGFFLKGLSIVCPCNTKVSVFQVTYSCT